MGQRFTRGVRHGSKAKKYAVINGMIRSDFVPSSKDALKPLLDTPPI